MASLTRFGWVTTLAMLLAVTSVVGCGGSEKTDDPGANGGWENGEGDGWDTASGTGTVEGDGTVATTEGGDAAPMGGDAAPMGGDAAPMGGDAAPAPAAAPAADPDVIELYVEKGADGAMLRVNTASPTMMAVAGMNADELIGLLKGRKKEITEAGLKPRVLISAPIDVNFDEVVKPVMQASFRAGFGIDYVQYVARK